MTLMVEGGASVTQVGVGGLLVLLVLDKFIAFAKSFKVNGSNGASNKSGDQPKEYWLMQFEALGRIGEAQTEILKRMEETQNKMSEGLARLITLQETQRDWHGSDRRHSAKGN
jgi:hypothetical protein